MSDGTAIEWTRRPGTIGATLNALVGCQKVSQGCAHCYAIETAHLRAHNPLPIMQEKFGGTVKVEGGKRVWTGKVTLTEAALLAPLTKKRPRTYFVNAMSDLFYEGVPDEWIDRHFAVFALCPQHTFIVLTKRPERMRAYLSKPGLYERIMTALGELVFELTQDDSPFAPDELHRMLSETMTAADPQPGQRIAFTFSLAKLPLPNVWLGVSVEDQKTADERIPLLLQTPAAVRFISAEPLLGPLDLERVPLPDAYLSMNGITGVAQPLTEKQTEADDYRYHTRLGYKLDWVICGGESGAGARPMHPEWPRSLRDQCQAAGVPFFFKQWGEWAPFSQRQPGQLRDSVSHDLAIFGSAGVWRTSKNATAVNADLLDNGADGCWRIGKKAAGHLLDGREWHQFPEVRS